jgi:hypothetical protein
MRKLPVISIIFWVASLFMFANSIAGFIAFPSLPTTIMQGGPSGIPVSFGGFEWWVWTVSGFVTLIVGAVLAGVWLGLKEALD